MKKLFVIVVAVETSNGERHKPVSLISAENEMAAWEKADQKYNKERCWVYDIIEIQHKECVLSHVVPLRNEIKKVYNVDTFYGPFQFIEWERLGISM